MTVIRLLNNQVATKEEHSLKKISRAVLVICIISKVKVMLNVKRNQYKVTQQRKAPESGKKSELPKHSKQQTRATPSGRTAEATSFPTKSENDRITVVVGDSIIKNLQGRKLAKTVGHRVVVKPFPGTTQTLGTTIHNMKSHIIATVEKCPDLICLHIGTNDLKSKEPNLVADAIVDLAREIENST